MSDNMLELIRKKGYTLVEVGARWNLSERQMSRVVKSTKQRDIDAFNGLPNKQRC